MTKQQKSRSWHWAISWLVYALVSVLMTWPLLGNLDKLLAGQDADIYNVYWGNWWVSKALLNGENPYMTSHLIYPVGFDLTTFAFSPFLAVLWFPLSRITSSIAAYNLVVGQEITIQVAALNTWYETTVPIVGLIDYFPTLDPRAGFFAITNIDPIFELVGTELPHNIWISICPCFS